LQLPITHLRDHTPKNNMLYENLHQLVRYMEERAGA
jgi:hypothetical protein